MLKFKTCHFVISNTHSYWNKWLLILIFTCIGFAVAAQAPVISYVTPQTYTQNATIAPLAPANSGGTVPATIYGQVTTFAGNGTTGFANGQGTAAIFNNPTRLGQDAAGNLYVADRDNGLIRKITPLGLVTTFASGFNQPNGVTVDPTGNVYVADAANNLIVKISPTGIINSFAGTGSQGSTNGPGNAASFYYPYSVAIDAVNNIYVADDKNNLIRKITPGGVVSTLAGTGIQGYSDGIGTVLVMFNNPSCVATDINGNVFVADPFNNRIRKITPSGEVSTYAGSGIAGTTNGQRNVATFNTPAGVTVDAIGNVYVVDIADNTLRKIDILGNVTTLAGSGLAGATDGVGTAATFNRPNDVQSNPSGFLYVTDYGNNIIRKVIVTGYTIDKVLPAGLSFDPKTGIISGTPTVLSPAINYTITGYNVYGSSTTIVSITIVASSLKPSILTPSPAPPTRNPNNTFNENVTSTNNETPITYTSSDTNIVIINPDGTISIVGPGSVVITANQVGDANYTPAVPLPLPLVSIFAQIINFQQLSAKTICDGDFSAGVHSSNLTIPITYTSSNTSVATISATGLIHIVGPGSTSITASQAGATYYSPALPITQVLTVTGPSPPTVAVTTDVQSTCVGYPINFTAVVTNVSVGASLSYQWQVNGVNAGTNSATFTSTTLTAAMVVQCIVSYGGACGSLSGTSNPIAGLSIPFTTPSITITSSQTVPVCSGSTITFTATPVNGGTAPIYQWQVNGQNSGTNSPTFSANTFADGDIITCILTNTGGKCLTTLIANSNAIPVSIIAQANPGQAVSITSSANIVYFGVPITFTATTTNTGNAIDYQWQVNGNNAGSNSPTFTSSNLNNGDVVTCIVFISTGCIPVIVSNGITANILPPPVVTVVNTFTPNGDGINDLWDIPALNSYPNCLVSVYTRYGSLVYQSRGYPTAWDGNYKDKPLPEGTYYYVINLGNNTAKLSGFVAIIR